MSSKVTKSDDKNLPTTEYALEIPTNQSPTSSLSRPTSSNSHYYSFSQSQVKIKVLVHENKSVLETRGFAIQTCSLDQEYLNMVNTLTDDYGYISSLTYIDSDGDSIVIKAKSDFLYAIECHLEIQNNSNKALKLYATIPSISDRYGLPSLKQNSPKNLVISMTEVDLNSNEVIKKLGQIGKSVSHSSLITGGSSIGGNEVMEQLLLGKSPIKSQKAVTSVQLIWQKGDIIGSGSFGQVYSGIDLTTGQKLAVKEVSLGNGSNHKSQVKALEQEIKILSQLDHPNIIKYFGAEVMEGEHMRFFLDYAEEGSVKDILNQHGKLFFDVKNATK